MLDPSDCRSKAYSIGDRVVTIDQELEYLVVGITTNCEGRFYLLVGEYGSRFTGESNLKPWKGFVRIWRFIGI